MTYNTVLRDYRRKLGINQDRLAQKTGITRTRINKIERDAVSADTNDMYIFSRTFGPDFIAFAADKGIAISGTWTDPPTKGEVIARYRQRAGLTKKGLGEKIGVSDSAVQFWEKDVSTPQQSSVQALNGLFGPEFAADYAAAKASPKTRQKAAPVSHTETRAAVSGRPVTHSRSDTVELTDAFRENLKKTCGECGVSQADLRRIAGVSGGAVSEILSGKRTRLTTDVVGRITAAMAKITKEHGKQMPELPVAQARKENRYEDVISVSDEDAARAMDAYRAEGWELAAKLYHYAFDEEFLKYWHEKKRTSFFLKDLFKLPYDEAKKLLDDYENTIPLEVSELVSFIHHKKQVSGIVVRVAADSVSVLAGKEVITVARKDIIRTNSRFSTDTMSVAAS